MNTTTAPEQASLAGIEPAPVHSRTPALPWYCLIGHLVGGVHVAPVGPQWLVHATMAQDPGLQPDLPIIQLHVPHPTEAEARAAAAGLSAGTVVIAGGLGLRYSAKAHALSFVEPRWLKGYDALASAKPAEAYLTPGATV